jgi:hypothetical protein
MGAGDFLKNARGAAKAAPKDAVPEQTAETPPVYAERRARQIEDDLRFAAKQAVGLIEKDAGALQWAAQRAIAEARGENESIREILLAITSTVAALTNMARDPEAQTRAGAILQQLPVYAKAEQAALIFSKVSRLFPLDPLDVILTEKKPPISKYSKALQDAIEAGQALLGQVLPSPVLPGQTAPGQTAQNQAAQNRANNPHVQELIHLVQAGQLALMSDDAYSAARGQVPVTVPGFRRATPEDLKKLGLAPTDFVSRSPNFCAQLYVSAPNIQPAVCVLAFAPAGPADSSGIIADVEKAVGIPSDAHKKAMDLARMAQRAAQLRGAFFQVTGHSLGGGLAQTVAAGLAADGRAVSGAIFNAAAYKPGAHQSGSAIPGPVAGAENILTSYRVAGEPVTEFLNSAKGAHGASAPGRLIPGPSDASLSGLHGIKSVEGGLAAKHRETYSAVRNLLGQT